MLANLKYLYKKYEYSKARTDFYKKIANVRMDSFKIDIDLEKFKNIKKLNLNLDKLKIKINNYRRIPEFKIILEDVNVSKIATLNSYLKDISLSKNKFLSLKEKISSLDNILNNLINERSELHKEIKVCPLCDSELH
jgi:hypothetical protein